jgi:hypothetical protein
VFLEWKNVNCRGEKKGEKDRKEYGIGRTPMKRPATMFRASFDIR